MTVAERKMGEKKQNKSGIEPLMKNSSGSVKYCMRLFVAGDEANSVIARKNIDEICTAHFKGDVRVDIIDVFEDFSAVIEENVLVTPALIIDEPKKARIYGNLQDRQKVLAALESL